MILFNFQKILEELLINMFFLKGLRYRASIASIKFDKKFFKFFVCFYFLNLKEIRGVRQIRIIYFLSIIIHFFYFTNDKLIKCVFLLTIQLFLLHSLQSNLIKLFIYNFRLLLNPFFSIL